MTPYRTPALPLDRRPPDLLARPHVRPHVLYGGRPRPYWPDCLRTATCGVANMTFVQLRASRRRMPCEGAP